MRNTYRQLKNSLKIKNKSEDWKNLWLNRSYSQVEENINNIDKPHRSWLMEKLVAPSDSKNILEIGCGWGPNLLCLSEICAKSSELFGLELSKSSVEVSRKYISKSNIKIIQGDGCDLSKIGDLTMDLVFTDAVFLYFDKKMLCQSLSLIHI